MIHPEGAGTFSNNEAKLAQFAAIAEAVSQQKLDATDKNPVIRADFQECHGGMNASSGPRRICLGVPNFSEAHASVLPTSKYGLPSTMLRTGSISDLQSSRAKKRQRTMCSLSGEEQQLSVASTKLGLQTDHKEQQLKCGIVRGYSPGMKDRSSLSLESVRGVRFRGYQAELWSEKFEELCAFRRAHGHCHVTHRCLEHENLAQWVKRQRYQYKLKLEGKRSGLSDERICLLNNIGFIWNSHDAVWEERLQELLEFKRIHGHCNVPTNYEANPPLAVWIKRQRQIYKKHQDGEQNSMTQYRITQLETIGFAWEFRKKNAANDTQRNPPYACSFTTTAGHGPSGVDLVNGLGTTMGDVHEVTNRSTISIQGSSFLEKITTGENERSLASCFTECPSSHSVHAMPNNAGYSLGRSTIDRMSGMELPTSRSRMSRQEYENSDIDSFGQGKIQITTSPLGEETARSEESKIIGRSSDNPRDLLQHQHRQYQKQKKHDELLKTTRCDFLSFSQRFTYSPRKVKQS